MLWKQRSIPGETEVAPMGATPHIPRELARLLAARGINSEAEIENFLHPSFAHLHSPYDMLGMAAAVERVCAALQRNEKILIYGDYDVDGTVAVVILKTAIERCGGVCEFHVPHRVREGYGMRDDVIERAAAGDVRLILSVDTGIRAFAAADTARRLGIDLIITDHHLPHTGGVPPALAVLNPNQPGCAYPCKFLCGAGVAFKLAQALLARFGLEGLAPSFLKVVAIATVADAVPLLGENRVLAKLGLEALRRPVNPGLQALMNVAQVNAGRALAAGEVAFRLAPRLNAAGRMDVAHTVIELFAAREPARAEELARRLDSLNTERRLEEQRVVQEIEAQIASDPSLQGCHCLVVDGDGWHRGVLGIAASRLLERFQRPTLVIARNGHEGEANGSARSIENFHMLEALESCSQLFTRFGGHAHAAGFALPVANIPALRAALDARARIQLQAADLQPALAYDFELPLDSITSEFFADLQRMEPFGMGNPEPVFVARNVQIMSPPSLLKDKHFKISVRQNASRAAGPVLGRRGFQAIGWRLGDRIQADGLRAQDAVDLAFSITRGTYEGGGELQLEVRDLERSNAVRRFSMITGTLEINRRLP